MEQRPGIEAVVRLARMGYRFTVNGETIKAKYDGPGKPDPVQVRPLLSLLKAHKLEAIDYLARQLQPPERILTCFECDHFRPASSSPNIDQAWGHCWRWNKGRFGVAMACADILYSGTPEPSDPKGGNTNDMWNY